MMKMLKSSSNAFELVKGGDCYPRALYDLGRDAPHTLYGFGNWELLEDFCVGIVGARKASSYGLAVSKMLARICVSQGVLTVSGGAIGCDQAAGKETLKQGGKHLVILGGGADVCYPANAASFFQEVLSSGGVILSEQAWGTQALRWTFPRRNRIIAALSNILVISEAGLPSGSAITAQAALELGREVCSVPGSIFSKNSRGCNKLIEDGAQPIWDEESFRLCLQRLNYCKSCNSDNDGIKNPTYREIVMRLKDECAVIEEIIRSLMSYSCRPQDLADNYDLEISEVLSLLGRLEVFGLAFKMRDGSYCATTACLLEFEQLEL